MLNLAGQTIDAEHSDFDVEYTGNHTIQSKLTPAQLNIEKSTSRKRAADRVTHVASPKLTNESDSSFRKLPATGIMLYR